MKFSGIAEPRISCRAKPRNSCTIVDQGFSRAGVRHAPLSAFCAHSTLPLNCHSSLSFFPLRLLTLTELRGELSFPTSEEMQV